jgi:hypothetical protein
MVFLVVMVVLPREVLVLFLLILEEKVEMDLEHYLLDQIT